MIKKPFLSKVLRFMDGQCRKIYLQATLTGFKFSLDFIENYNETIDERYFLEVDIQYPK